LCPHVCLLACVLVSVPVGCWSAASGTVIWALL
jgi:hypothetical protein